MKLTKILAASACALPLLALAQTPAVVPADQPSSDLQRKQTTDNGQATQYGGPGTSTGGSMSKPDSGKKASKSKGDTSKGGQTATGDVPTYPAPAKDGTPTK